MAKISPDINKNITSRDKLPVPIDLYAGKAAFTLFERYFTKDYISGGSNLSEDAKRRNRIITYALLTVVVGLLVGLFILTRYIEI